VLKKGTIRENLYLNGLSKGIAYKTLRYNEGNIIHFAELSDYKDRPFNVLSTGQRMRLALSVSLYAESDMYLIDEWIGALDENYFKKYNQAFINKFSSGHSLVIASHNQNLLKKMCNKWMRIEGGRIVDQGTDFDLIA
jgi:ABC-type polysaccharide/polyol phosphate transport system ATPase subunit